MAKLNNKSSKGELSVYGASVAEINVLQQFLDRCYKLRFISTQLNIRSLLQKQDKAIFQKAKQHDNHPLKVCLPQEKNNLTYNLRRKSFQRPKINTERYKNTFVNRLIFKYNLYVLRQIYVTSFSHCLIFLFHCNLAELLIFLSCNIRYVFLSNEQ